MENTAENKLGRQIADIARAAEERDAERRAKAKNLRYVDLRKIPVSIEAVRLLSESDARSGQVVPVQINAESVAVAAHNPDAAVTKDALTRLDSGHRKVEVFIASLSGINETLRMYELISGNSQGITGSVSIGKSGLDEAISRLTSINAIHDELSKIDFSTVSTTQLLEAFLGGALSTRTSDIHFEAEEKSARARYRIDGVLHDVVTTLPIHNYDTLVSRIKLLSGMKMNVHGEAQDGRFTIHFKEKEIEMRVSIIPSEFGETVVMRVLDPDAINVGLENLGLRPDDMDIVNAELKKPNGLILNTGPTGSGKTTTLYAFLRKLVSPELKIITVEDPIEYRVDGISQTQVDPEAGYTFAKGLRAIVRQDPDVVLVGEIRDLETADIALQASLTGHLVLSTLHTNDAIGALPRLLDLGVKAQTIGSALTLVIAQRLVRKLCDNCKKPLAPSAETEAKIRRAIARMPARVNKDAYKDITMFEPAGCEKCNQFGYKGRRGIFEFFQGGPELEQIILSQVSDVALTALAKKQGMVMMQEDGILKVVSGLTTLDEVESVTGPIMWDSLTGESETIS